MAPAGSIASRLSDPEGDKAQLMDAKEYFEAMKDKIAREAKKLYG